MPFELDPTLWNILPQKPSNFTSQRTLPVAIILLRIAINRAPTTGRSNSCGKKPLLGLTWLVIQTLPNLLLRLITI